MRLIDQGGWGRDTLIVIPPRAAIAHVAEFFWIEEWDARRPRRGRYRIVADDAPHIIWHLYDGRHRTESFALVGARSVYRDIDVTRRMLTVGVRLRPGSLALLRDGSARRWTDRSTPLPHALPAGRVRSPERVIEAFSTLLARADPSNRARALVEHLNALDPRGRNEAADLARALGVSDRTLRNQTRDTLGLGFKRFLRIRRLHAALRLHQVSPRVSWSRVATESGYADQAHLIRDCQALLGETPAAFERRGRE